MQKFGKRFKELREEKNISTKEASENIVSVQFLRRFEKDENDIKISNFHKLLNRINVTYDEFMSDNSVDEYEYTIEKLEEIIDLLGIKKDYLAVQKLINKYEEKYLNTNELRYLHYTIIIKASSNKLCNTSYEVDIDTIYEYLSKCDVWYRHEFFLATYCIHYFNDNSIKSMAKLSFLYIAKNKSTRTYQIDFILHLVVALLNRNFIEEADNLLQKYNADKNTSKTLQYMSYNTFSIFLEGLILIKKGDKTGITKCEEIIKFFSEILDYKGYANMLFENYLRIYNDSPLKK